MVSLTVCTRRHRPNPRQSSMCNHLLVCLLWRTFLVFDIELSWAPPPPRQKQPTQRKCFFRGGREVCEKAAAPKQTCCRRRLQCSFFYCCYFGRVRMCLIAWCAGHWRETKWSVEIKTSAQLCKAPERPCYQIEWPEWLKSGVGWLKSQRGSKVEQDWAVGVTHLAFIILFLNRIMLTF